MVIKRSWLGVVVAVVGLVAAPSVQAADPPCFDNANRFVSCGNGTVTDTVTGLVWLRNANCFGARNYANANRSAANLQTGRCGLTDGSAAGDWRLPTKAEWETMIDRAVGLGCFAGSAPSVTNDPGTGCLEAGPTSFTGVQLSIYWSSSALEANPTEAWGADLLNGNVSITQLSKPTGRFVWPVRAGR
jgi:hypothetical protein